MGKFNRNEKSWGHKGGGHGGFRRDFGKGRMFPAVCAECGNDCEVPFKPTGDKPVFCNRCFESAGGRNSKPQREFRPQRSFEEKPKAANNEELKVQFEQLNAKLDRILKMLAPVVTPEAKEVKEVKEVKEKKTVKKAAAKAKPAKKAAIKAKPAKK
ncbi:hypothetical protein JXD20_02700 [Candidatus Peregrinibacteria bacterium]|nr:hypothetical protein [Candidatus Peregrinibacteria bacterium]